MDLKQQIKTSIKAVQSVLMDNHQNNIDIDSVSTKTKSGKYTIFVKAAKTGTSVIVENTQSTETRKIGMVITGNHHQMIVHNLSNKERRELSKTIKLSYLESIS